MSYYEQELLCAGKDLIKEMRRNREANDDMQKKELAARNRVDISLDEYLAMRDEIKELEGEVERLNKLIEADDEIFKKLGIPLEIIPSIYDVNVEVLDSNDPVTMDSIKYYKIGFKVKNRSKINL